MDTKRGFSIEGHSEVKGQVSAIMQKKRHINTAISFRRHKVPTISTKKNANEYRKAPVFTKTSKLTFANK